MCELYPIWTKMSKPYKIKYKSVDQDLMGPLFKHGPFNIFSGFVKIYIQQRTVFKPQSLIF